MKTKTRVRRPLSAVILAAAIATPATLAMTASPASAYGCLGTQCYPINHNEDAALDDQR